MFAAKNIRSHLSHLWFLFVIFNFFLFNASLTHAETITYDANGNATSDGAGTNTYSSSSNKITSHAGSTVTTDTAGNITSDGAGTTFTYNNANRLIQVFKSGNLVATFTYNAKGQRTSKTTPASTTAFHYDMQGHLIEETTGTGGRIASYMWVEDTPLAVVFAPHTESNPGNQDRVIYIHIDHLNTPRSATDAAGKIVWRWDSNASGRNAPNQDPGNTGIQTVINLRFPGQYYDKETALLYNWNRYYDPNTRRYITSDPIGLEGGTNTYAYAKNNSVNYSDPDGLTPQGQAVGGAVGAVVGGVLGGLGGGVVGTVGGPVGTVGGGAAGAAEGAAAGAAVGSVVGDALTGSSTEKNCPKCTLKFLREVYYSGSTKSCVYTQSGSFGMFTFPQWKDKPCYPVNLETCKVDTSTMDPALYSKGTK